MELQATKTSIITVTRNSSVELSKALRKIFLKLTSKFVITDIEYGINYNTESLENIYSAMIIGNLTTGGVIDLTEYETNNPDGIVLNIQSDEDAPSSAVVGTTLKVATVDNNGLMSKQDKQILAKVVEDLATTNEDVTVLEGKIDSLTERIEALEAREDNDTVYNDTEVQEALQNLQTALNALQTKSDEADDTIEESIATINGEIQSINEGNTANIVSINTTLSTIQEAIATLESKESHEADIEEALSKIEELETALASNKTADDEVSELLDTLKTSFETFKTTVNTKIDENVESITQDIEDLKVKADDTQIQKKLKDLQEEVATINNYNIQGIKSDIATLQTAVSGLSNYDDTAVVTAIDSIKSVLATHLVAKTVEDKDGNITEIDAVYDTKKVQDAIKALKQSVATLESKTDYDDTEVRGLITATNDTITTVQASLEEAIAEDKATLTTVSNDLQELKDLNIESTLATINETIEELNTKSAGIATNATNIETLTATLTALETKVGKDDTEGISKLIADISTSIANIETRLTDEENKVDKDTPDDYDTVKNTITELQTALGLNTQSDTIIANSVSAINTFVGTSATYTSVTTNFIDKDKSIVENLIILDSKVKTIDEKEDKDTKYDNQIDAINTFVGTALTYTTSINFIDKDKSIVENLIALDAKIKAVDSKEDKDTVYNDEEVRGLIVGINAKIGELEDNETVSSLISALKNTVDNLENYDDTEIKNSIAEAEEAIQAIKDDPDYENSGLSAKIEEIEESLTVLGNIATNTGSINALNTTVTNLSNFVGGVDTYTSVTTNFIDKDKSIVENLIALDAKIKAVDSKEDKDTVYDDANVQASISTINNKIGELEDDETVAGLIEALQGTVDGLNNYDDTAIQASIANANEEIAALKAKPDYDDSEIKESIAEIEDSLEVLSGIATNKASIDTLNAKVSAIETSLTYSTTATVSKIDVKKGVAENLVTLDQAIATLEAKEDKDTIYDDTEIKDKISAIKEQLTYTTVTTSIVDKTKNIANAIDTIDAKLVELDSRTDSDTVYDDTEVKNDVTSIKTFVGNASTYGTVNYIDSSKSVVENISTLDTAIKANADNIAQAEIQITQLNTDKLNKSEVFKNGYFNATKTRANGDTTIIRDEETGGGIFVETPNMIENKNIKTFIGVNIGTQSVPVNAQLYSINTKNNNSGVKININQHKIVYIKKNVETDVITDSEAENTWMPAGRELAVQEDITNALDSKVGTIETPAQAYTAIDATKTVSENLVALDTALKDTAEDVISDYISDLTDTGLESADVVTLKTVIQKLIDRIKVLEDAVNN